MSTFMRPLESRAAIWDARHLAEVTGAIYGNAGGWPREGSPLALLVAPPAMSLYAAEPRNDPQASKDVSRIKFGRWPWSPLAQHLPA